MRSLVEIASTRQHKGETSTGKAAIDTAAISAGNSRSLFHKTDGTLWATGDNSYGQFGCSMADSGPDGWSTATGTETVQSIDAEWECVIIEEDPNGQPKRFGRVKVVSQ